MKVLRVRFFFRLARRNARAFFTVIEKREFVEVNMIRIDRLDSGWEVINLLSIKKEIMSNPKRRVSRLKKVTSLPDQEGNIISLNDIEDSFAESVRL